MTDRPNTDPSAGARFTVHVYCSNCATEYDMTFPRGTKFDTRGWGDEVRLVDATKAKYEIGATVRPTDIPCRECGIARLHLQRRTA